MTDKTYGTRFTDTESGQPDYQDTSEHGGAEPRELGVPNADLSEEAVVCAILTRGVEALQECGRLEADHFLDPGCRAIYAAADALWTRGELVDDGTIPVELANRGELEMIGGGNAGLIEIVIGAATNIHTQKHAEIVWNGWHRRHKIELGRRYGEAAYKGEDAQPHIAAMAEHEAMVFGDDNTWSRMLTPEDDDAELTDVQYLIRGLLPADGVAVVTAATSSGKSSLAVALAAHVAAGRTEIAERGIHAWNRTVVHVDPEGSAKKINSRLRAIYSAHEFTVAEQYACAANYRHVVKPRRKLTDGLAQWLVSELAGQSVGLVVIDGLLRLSGAANENDNSEMVRVMDYLAWLAEELNCPVWVNHHTAKTHQSGSGGKNIGRGASAVEDAADVVARIDHDVDTGKRTFAMTKGRDIGLTPGQLTYEVAGWTIGDDPHGLAITAPVAVDFEWVARQTGSAKDRNARELAERASMTVAGDELSTSELAAKLDVDRRRLSELKTTFPQVLADLGIRCREVGNRVYWSISESD